MDDSTRDHTPRLGGVIWGLLLVLLGLATMAHGLGWSINLEILAILALLMAGLGLLIRALLGSSPRG